MSWFKDYFYNTKEMTEKEYKRAKTGFIVSCATSGSANNFTAGAYLAALLAYLGANEVESNFIMSLGTFAGFMQLLVPIIMAKIAFKKPFVWLCEFFDRMPMALMFLTPFIFKNSDMAIVAVGIFCVIGFSCSALKNPAFNEWFIDCGSYGGSFGKYCGIKDAGRNASLVISYFIIAFITKHFIGDIEVYGYMWLGICALILWAINIVSLTIIKEPYRKEVRKEAGAGLIKTFKIIFTYKKMRRYITHEVIYNFGYGLMGSLSSILFVQRLKLPLEFLSYMMVLEFIIRMALAPVCGQLADKFGARKMLSIGILAYAATFSVCAFATPENAVVIRVLFAVLCALGQVMIMTPLFLFMSASLPDTNRASCMAATNLLFLPFSYGAALLTTWFIGVANGMTFNILGYKFSEMGMVFVVGSLILVIDAIVVVFNKKARKQKEV